MSEKNSLILTQLLIILIIGSIISIFIINPVHDYSDNKITGRVVARALIVTRANYICQVNFSEGWNLVSIPCVPGNTTVNSMLNDINGNYYSIHTYDRLDSIDPWKSFNPSLPSWVIQDLSNIDYKKGYWININANTSLIINGTISIPTEIYLYEGWNLVGYSANRSKASNESFASISSILISAHAYNVSDAVDPWKSYNPSLPPSVDQDLNNTVLYWGYWLRTSTDGVWIIW